MDAGMVVGRATSRILVMTRLLPSKTKVGPVETREEGGEGRREEMRRKRGRDGPLIGEGALSQSRKTAKLHLPF